MSKQDGILGIVNRTENWKTAQLFHGLSDDGKVALAKRLGEPDGTPADDIRIELFWKGVRDYAHCHGDLDLEKVTEIYDCRFANLRQKIETSKHRFNDLKGHNYVVSPETQKDLYNNLRNTEIDIVLETPKHLFIGEAKHESRFGGAGKLILVHQLVRQYVTATILLALVGEDKCVVPFVVADADEHKSVNRTAQVEFMVDQGWLKRENVLCWDDVFGISDSQ